MKATEETAWQNCLYRLFQWSNSRSCKKWKTDNNEWKPWYHQGVCRVNQSDSIDLWKCNLFSDLWLQWICPLLQERFRRGTKSSTIKLSIFQKYLRFTSMVIKRISFKWWIIWWLAVHGTKRCKYGTWRDTRSYGSLITDKKFGL